MTVIIGIDPHKSTHTAGAIAGSATPSGAGSRSNLGRR
jgi:hypothetical protein